MEDCSKEVKAHEDSLAKENKYIPFINYNINSVHTTFQNSLAQQVELFCPSSDIPRELLNPEKVVMDGELVSDDEWNL